MSQEMPKESKNQIMAAFRQLLAKQQQIESRVATKEEEAQKCLDDMDLDGDGKVSFIEFLLKWKLS